MLAWDILIGFSALAPIAAGWSLSRLRTFTPQSRTPQ